MRKMVVCPFVLFATVVLTQSNAFAADGICANFKGKKHVELSRASNGACKRGGILLAAADSSGSQAQSSQSSGQGAPADPCDAKLVVVTTEDKRCEEVDLSSFFNCSRTVDIKATRIVSQPGSSGPIGYDGVTQVNIQIAMEDPTISGDKQPGIQSVMNIVGGTTSRSIPFNAGTSERLNYGVGSFVNNFHVGGCDYRSMNESSPGFSNPYRFSFANNPMLATATNFLHLPAGYVSTTIYEISAR